MRFHRIHALTLAACLAGTGLGHPAKAQLVNGDFETGSYTFDGSGADSLAPGSTVITGWTTINNELAVINTPNSFGLTAQSGTKALDLTGYHDSAPYGGIQQLVNTVAGRSYTLDFFLGQQSGGLAGISVNTVGPPTTFTATTGGGVWQEVSTTFTATGSTLLSFTGATASDGGNYIGLDHITLTGNFTPAAATPEPGAYALLATGGLTGLAFLRRKKRLS